MNQTQTLQNLLNILQIVAGTIAKSAGGGAVGEGADIAAELLQISQASIAAYESHVGQPIDPGLLHPEAPIT